MNYTQAEIEKKRLLALQRKKQAQLKNNPSTPTSTKHSLPSNSSSIVVNKDKPSSGRISPSNGQSKYEYFKAKFRNDTIKTNPQVNRQKERFNPISTKAFFGQKSYITGKCYMITDERFTLDISKYFPPLIEALKTIPSKSYDMKTKNWNFLLKDYETVMEKIINFKSDVQIIGIPNPVLQIFRKKDTLESAVKDMDLSCIDPHLLENLMPFQREGVCYGISKGGRCMIADDMGLGKTIQALGIAHYFKKSWPLLIVAPASVRYHWEEAIHKFLPSIPAQYIQQFTTMKDYINCNNIIITTYDLLVRAADSFDRRTFGFVILDESHALKSVKTARFKAAQSVVSQARHVVLLSGTPALSRPIELYTQINLVAPNFMGYQEYGIRYCAGERTSFGWDFLGSSNMQELQFLLKRTCVIRRLKTEVLNQLPTKKREVIMLDPDLIKAGTKEMAEMSQKLERKALSGVERHTTLLQYYNESSIAKQKAVCDYISKIFKNKQKCIIFAHHQNVLDAVCNLASFMNIKYVRIDGRTNAERRKYEIDKFQNSDSYTAAVLSITAANAGITLTSAQLVVFAELFWNPGILCQAEDRVHRIGQDENVVIRYLVAKQTADDYLWPLIQKKMNVLNEVGLDQDFCLKDIDVTNQELRSQQRTLDYFTSTKQHEHMADEKLVENNENHEENECSTKDTLAENQSTTNELKNLLDIDEEDFDFCDWNDMD